MGIIISRFRSKKDTGERLAALDSKIRSIEQYGLSTEKQRRKVVANLLIFSVGLYVIAIIFFYFYFRPISWKDGVIYSIPLLVSPLLIFLLRNIISKYYDWKIKRNKTKLLNMRAEKKRLLEEVMDKETYKVAKELLDKYGNSEIEKSVMPVIKALVPSSGVSTPIKPNTSALISAPSPIQPRFRQTLGTQGPVGTFTPQRISMPQPISASPNQLVPLKPDLLPRPIMTAGGGGAFDRLVDYLIGDGSGNRFALICTACKSHNGMALPEEFEYLSFRCAYCRHLNPSKKTKPKPPVLMTTPLNSDTSDHKSSSDNSDVDESSTNLPNIGFNITNLSQNSEPSAPVSETDHETKNISEVDEDLHMSVDEDCTEGVDEGHTEVVEEDMAKNDAEDTSKPDVEKKED